MHRLPVPLVLFALILFPCAAPAAGEAWVETESGLRYLDLKVGEGSAAGPGMTVSIRYVGMLEDGTVFDRSPRRGRTKVFRIGEGRVIAGWEEGTIGMKPGGVRRLVIPPELGYGARGLPGKVPPHTTVIFDITVWGVN